MRKTISLYLFQNFCHISVTKVSDDLLYRVVSARKLVMIHDELLIVRGYTVDSADISFMLHELLDWWRSFYPSCFNCHSWSVWICVHVYLCVTSV